MSELACDDCGRVTPVLILTDYGCRYCRNCIRPDAPAAKPGKKSAKASKKSAPLIEETGEV